MTCADAIRASLDNLTRAHDTNGWTQRHRQAWQDAGLSDVDYRWLAPGKPDKLIRPFEAALVTGIESAARYADAHALRFGSPIGQDYVLGPCLADILRGLRGLLNGESGRLDCGTLDALILRIAEIAELGIE